MMSGISFWLTKDRRKLLSIIFSDFDKTKLKTAGERYNFKFLEEKIIGRYSGDFENGENT